MKRYKDWLSLVDAVDSCTLCEKIVLVNKVFGDGDVEADLVLVGEGPGRYEAKYATPFVGRAGQVLNEACVKAGIDREDNVYVTNVIRCRSFVVEDGKKKDRSPPLKEEIENCTPFLHNTLNFVRPKAICAMGLTATKVLLYDLDPGRKLSIGDYRKKLRMGQELVYTSPLSKAFQVPVIVAWHPSYVARSRSTNRFDELKNDLKKAFKLSRRS